MWLGSRFSAAKLKQNYPECTSESGVVEKAGLSFGVRANRWRAGGGGGEGSPSGTGGAQDGGMSGPYLGSG